MPIERITILCFAASYGVALGLELLQLENQRGRSSFRNLLPKRAASPLILQRLLCIGFGNAGLLAHTLFLAVQRPLLVTQFGSFLYLAWILAVFYVYGSLHHWRIAWGIFVLPVVLGLTILAAAFDDRIESASPWEVTLAVSGKEVWQFLHVALFVLAAVGICVAFMASIMYLVQARRLKAKALPSQGLRLFSLERLAKMIRRAIHLSFLFLTGGLILSVVRMVQEPRHLQRWADPKILSTVLLWILFAVVLYPRWGYRQGGRHVALLMIMAFALLLLTLITGHSSFSPGGGP